MRSRGFTLIEMAVVVAIVGVLAVGIAPVSSLIQQRAQERALKQALRDIRVALDRYHKAYESGMMPRQAGASGGGLGEVLGGMLGGGQAQGGGLGDILGQVLGGAGGAQKTSSADDLLASLQAALRGR